MSCRRQEKSSICRRESVAWDSPDRHGRLIPRAESTSTCIWPATPRPRPTSAIGPISGTPAPRKGSSAAPTTPSVSKSVNTSCMRGTTAFTTLVVPWNKGRQPVGLSISADAESLVVRTAHRMVRVNKSTLACNVVRD